MKKPSLREIADEIMAFENEGMAPAQAEQKNLQDRADWGRIGSDLGAVLAGTGRKADNSYWDSLESRGQQLVSDAQRTGQRRGRAMGEAHGRFDANEAREFRAQESEKKLQLMERIKQFDALEKQQAEERQRKEALEKEAREDARWKNRNATTANQALERARIMANQKQTGRVGDDAAKVGKDLEDLASQKHDFETLTVSTGQDDIPGVGLIDSRLPDVFDSPEATANKQAILRTIQRIAKAQSGQAMSEAEAARIARARGILGGTEQQYRIGLKALMDEQRTLAKAREAKYPEQAVSAYKQRGGVTSADLPAPGGPGQIDMVSPTGEVFEVSADEVDEAEANGWKRVK